MTTREYGYRKTFSWGRRARDRIYRAELCVNSTRTALCFAISEHELDVVLGPIELVQTCGKAKHKLTAMIRCVSLDGCLFNDTTINQLVRSDGRTSLTQEANRTSSTASNTPRTNLSAINSVCRRQKSCIRTPQSPASSPVRQSKAEQSRQTRRSNPGRARE